MGHHAHSLLEHEGGVRNSLWENCSDQFDYAATAKGIVVMAEGISQVAGKKALSPRAMKIVGSITRVCLGIGPLLTWASPFLGPVGGPTALALGTTASLIGGVANAM